MHKLKPTHVTRIVRFHWSAVFEGFRNKHQIELCSIQCMFLVHVS